MATLIQASNGNGFYTNATLEQTRSDIELGNTIDVWWFAAWGQRFTERLFIPMDQVEYLRTESDDG